MLQPDPRTWDGSAPRIDQVDASAARTYQAAIEALQTGKQTPVEAARRITAAIVPEYDGLASSLGKVNRRIAGGRGPDRH